MNKKRVLSLVAATILSVSVLAGCGAKNDAKSELKDGNYVVEASAEDKNGFRPTLTVEVKDGKIASADYDEVKADGTKKEADEAYNSKMKELKGTNPAEAFPVLEKAMVEKQSAEVDAATGATSSSNSFKALAEKAMENIKAGKTETTQVELSK